MRYKLFCIVIALTLSMRSFIAISTFTSRSINKIGTQQIAGEDLEISIIPTNAFFGVNLNIKNTGTMSVNDVEWSFRTKPVITSTGLLLTTLIQTGSIDEIAAGETETLRFFPFNQNIKMPIGFGNVYMTASALSTQKSVRTQQRAYNFGSFLFNFKDTYMDIKPDDAYARFLNEEFDIIIDVVGLDIYNNVHLPGAVNYVWADGTLNSKIDELDPSLTYLVYCHTDPPSTASAQALVNAGFKTVYRLEGNFAAWKDARYPIET